MIPSQGPAVPSGTKPVSPIPAHFLQEEFPPGAAGLMKEEEEGLVLYLAERGQKQPPFPA